MIESEITSVREVETTATEPDGVYDGLWGGWCVKWEALNHKYEGIATKGILGRDIPCTVIVKNGKFSVTEKYPMEVIE